MAVFLFYGDDTFSQREKLNFWRKEFEKKYGDMNTSVISGKEAKAQEIFQTCSAMPFLAEKRFTAVKDFMSEGSKEEVSAMAEFIEKIPDFCILVFAETGEVDKRLGLYKKIQKFGKLTEFPSLTGSKLLGWIEKMVVARGGSIEKEAVLSLSQLVGGDLYRLENEIAKLTAYASGRPITKRDGELLVDTQLAASIFRLTDGIGQKNPRLCLETLHQLIDSGEDLHRVLYMIMRQFRIILTVKDLHEQRLSRDQIVAKMREHPFVISNTLAQTKNFSLEQIAKAYELLIELDTKLKSGGIKILAGDNREFVLAMDRLILDLCQA